MHDLVHTHLTRHCLVAGTPQHIDGTPLTEDGIHLGGESEHHKEARKDEQQQKSATSIQARA